ncbi:hypothetical protein QFC19_001544 [Naganishia cerealis]|uniref:Uncharacterized protein n=1 Tax=Naganishia cerealis TaxID=610337 RepID=A0ACC2WGT5_9TREE|nr:hypothetical protein QFC19_001544 [Naganishia cerealis]
MEFIFHGTGTSSALPLVPCVTSTPRISDIQCRCCREAVASMVHPGEEDEDVGAARVNGGERNKRGNTGGIVRKRGEDGEWKTIVIDVGKTFRDQATWLFRKHQIRRIDAVILTHGHQDAIAGLGKSLIHDLRAFTAPPSPQAGAIIPIYLSRATLDAVAQQFPYLVDRNQATGGGDVPSLDFRVFDDDDDVVGGQGIGGGFDVAGIRVVPLPVHHGKYFTPPDQVERLDVPEKQTQPQPQPQTAPQTPPQMMQTKLDGVDGRNAIQPSLTSLLHRKIDESVKATVPFYCYGFVICLHLSPRATYFVGFTHPNAHDEWVAACREVEGTRTVGEEDGFLRAVGESAVKQGEVMESVWERARGEWKGFVRPAYDGQVVRIE